MIKSIIQNKLSKKMENKIQTNQKPKKKDNLTYVSNFMTKLNK